MKTKEYSMLEIATEVAWQVGDSLGDSPRAESRWYACDIAKRIIEEGVIKDVSEDIDEIISTWLIENGEIDDE
jgi:hypothetical protein